MTTTTERFNWPVPAWNADWSGWQNIFSDLVNNIESTSFGLLSNSKLIMKELPNVEVQDLGGGNWVLTMSEEAVFISRSLLTEIRIPTGNTALTANSILGVSFTPGAVGPQNISWQVYSQSVSNATEIIPVGYVDDSYNIIWYNGARLTAGGGVSILFDMGGSGSLYNMNETYDAFGGVPATVVVDGLQGQGDLTFQLTDDKSFNVDLSNNTGTADGFHVTDGGAEYFKLTRKADNQIDMETALRNVYLDASSDMTFKDQYLSSAIALSESGNATLDTSSQSIVGSINEIHGSVAAPLWSRAGSVLSPQNANDTVEVSKAGTVTALADLLAITNSGNAASMTDTRTGFLFNQWYYDAGTPAVADAARIVVGTEGNWTSTASTQDSYMSFSTALNGTVAEKMKITSGGNVAIGGITPSYKFSIGSTDGSDQIGFYHNGLSAYCRWTDGQLILQTDEGTNTDSIVAISGHGTGKGVLSIYDGDEAEQMELYCQGGRGYIRVVGTTPLSLRFQGSADVDVEFFNAASSTETRELKIYGNRSGTLRSLQMGCDVDAENTASFDGLSNYLFDGIIYATGDQPYSSAPVSATSIGYDATSGEGWVQAWGAASADPLVLQGKGGNVAIGGITPTENLHIYSDDDCQLLIENSDAYASGSYALRVVDDGSDVLKFSPLYTTGDSVLILGKSGRNGGLDFYSYRYFGGDGSYDLVAKTKAAGGAFSQRLKMTGNADNGVFEVSNSRLSVTHGDVYTNAVASSLSMGFDTATPYSWIQSRGAAAVADLVLQGQGGNVGIGTVPSGALHIKGSGWSDRVILEYGAGQTSIQFTESGLAAGDSYTIGRKHSDDTFAFAAGNDMDVNRVFTINRAQLIGIGTTDFDGTPAAGKLIVKGSSNDGSTNCQVWRDSDEANIAELDTNGNLKFLTGINQTFKGGDLTSANDMAVPTGNYCDVTGTTQINTMAVTSIQAGTFITLQFDGSVTVKHSTAGSGAQFDLTGDVDFSATAGDTLSVVYDGTVWRETTKTSGSLGTVTLDGAYNNGSGERLITIDDGDVRWLCSGLNSFLVDISGVSGGVNGFKVLNGADYFRLDSGGGGVMNFVAVIASCTLSSSAAIDIDASSGITMDVSSGAFDFTASTTSSITIDDVTAEFSKVPANGDTGIKMASTTGALYCTGAGLLSLYGTTETKLSSGGTVTITGVPDVRMYGNIGFGTGSFGTSADTVLSWDVGTAPTTSPASVVQLWCADRNSVADKAALHLRTEDGTQHVFGDLVGIGTINPGEALEVNGNIYLNTGNIITDTTTGTKIGTSTSQKLGFYNATPIVQPTEITDELTTITYTSPGTPDYAIQDLTNSSPYGFATQDEGNTVLSVIANLQARVNELESTLVNLGLLADAD